MTHGGLVSVIVPCYKSGAFVRGALDSISRQIHADWEVLAVDDGGPDDGTALAVREFAENFPGHRVELLQHETNRGLAAARNTAMKAARGDFFALLDPDDIWLPEHLESALAGLKSADLCVSRARSIDPGGTDLGPFLGDRMQGQIAAFPVSLAGENFLLPSCTVFRRSVFDAIGGFDETPLMMQGGSWDFWLRCHATGFLFHFLPDENVRYLKHPGGLTKNYLTTTRGCAECLKKHVRSGHPDLLPHLREALYVHLARLAYLKISFRDCSALRDARDAFLLQPLRCDIWSSLYRGLRNNW